MKLYNIFKWHIAVNANNRYVVRKFSPFWGWQYLDKDNVQLTWSDVGLYKYCVLDTLERAERLLGLSRGFKAV